ncbi:hypothetical protein VCHC55B2_0616 [Vibrio cholerae HC-55B2]|nr:hypothetical protein VCHC55B2_0616 [Vibrio cholerae HC-55B2]EKM05414.1 hypothetical protein VCHC44C1_0644 [Vibrio cholerae HC-44C1]
MLRNHDFNCVFHTILVVLGDVSIADFGGAYSTTSLKPC